jgi:hypothetical protein
MKSDKKTLVLLVLLLAVNIHSEIIPNRNLGKNKPGKKPKGKQKQGNEPEHHESPYEKLLKDVNAYFDDILKESKLDFKKKADKTGGAVYNISGKNAMITIKGESNQVQVSMINEYESHSLEFKDVEFEEQKEMITQNYVSSFLGDTNQIIVDIKTVFGAVESGLAGSKYEGVTGESSFTQVNGPSKIKGAAVPFTLTYTNSRVFMKSEPVTGSLKSDKGKFILTITTKFFEKSFELTVLTETFMITQSRKVGIRVLEHLDAMYYLNDNPEHEDIQRSFTFSNYHKQGADLLTHHFNNGDLKVSSDDKSLKVLYKGNPGMTVDVSTPNLNGLMFTIVKCKIENLSGDPYTLVLPGSSIFEMGGLIDKFLLEMGDKLRLSLSVIEEAQMVNIFA